MVSFNHATIIRPVFGAGKTLRNYFRNSRIALTMLIVSALTRVTRLSKSMTFGRESIRAERWRAETASAPLAARGSGRLKTLQLGCEFEAQLGGFVLGQQE